MRSIRPQNANAASIPESAPRLVDARTAPHAPPGAPAHARVVQALVDAIAALVDEKVAEALERRDEEFNSNALPPGVTSRKFATLCRAAHARGDRRVLKLGRTWYATAAAIEAPRPAPANDSPAVWSVDAALASVTRKAGSR